MQEKVIGILGGLGPDATCVLFERIINFTDTKQENEHIRVIIDNNPKIPDRTSSILKNTTSPVDEIVKTAMNLKNAGADFILIPCITAHYYFDVIQSKVDIPILNGLEITKKYIDKELKGIDKIGIIATSGTIKTNLFHNLFEDKEVIVPSSEEQDKYVMDIIYGENGIKSGNKSNEITERLVQVVNILKEKGAQAIIAGCTEISIVLDQEDIDIPLIDPLTLMAKESIRIVKNN